MRCRASFRSRRRVPSDSPLCPPSLHGPHSPASPSLSSIQGLDTACIADIANCATTINVPAGQVIIAAGSQAGPLFILDAGRCTVSVRGRQVALLESGDTFGEIALLSMEAHTADVTAVTNCQLLQIAPLQVAKPLLPTRLQIVSEYLRGTCERDKYRTCVCVCVCVHGCMRLCACAAATGARQMSTFVCTRLCAPLSVCVLPCV